MSDVKRKIARGAAWMVASNLLMRVLGMLSTIVLARLLMPSDFGLIALASALAAFVELLGAFSFQVALIQNQQAPRSHYDTVWTLTLLLAVLIGLILMLLATPAAVFYSEPRLQNVIYVVAIGIAIAGAENVGIVAFQKELEFHREFVFRLIKKAAGILVAIPLALHWGDYRALVAGIVAGQIAGLVASYRMHPFRPRISLSASRELLHFSKWLLLNNLIYVTRHRIADFVIGRVEGVRQLGVFTLAYEISTLATTALAAPINRAVLPGLARMSEDLIALRDGYFSATGMVALIGVPAAMGIAAIADSLIPVLFGTAWSDAIPIVRVLAFGGSVSILASSVGGVCIALGRPGLLTLASGIYVVILLPTLLVMTHQFGSIGAAWSFLITGILSLPVQLLIVLHLLKSGIREFVAVMWRPAVAAALLYSAVDSLAVWRGAAIELADQVVRLGFSVLVGVVCYVAVVLTLWQLAGRPTGAEAAIFDRLSEWRRGEDSNSRTR